MHERNDLLQRPSEYRTSRHHSGWGAHSHTRGHHTRRVHTHRKARTHAGRWGLERRILDEDLSAGARIIKRKKKRNVGIPEGVD